MEVRAGDQLDDMKRSDEQLLVCRKKNEEPLLLLVCMRKNEEQLLVCRRMND